MSDRDIEDTRMMPEEPIVRCKDCGDEIRTGDVALWIWRQTKYSAATDPVCEGCADQYQKKCGHKKNKIMSLDGSDFSNLNYGCTWFCSECEGMTKCSYCGGGGLNVVRSCDNDDGGCVNCHGTGWLDRSGNPTMPF
ncbi:MAG: hypothetical protein GY755_00570 [Chloroflexi bacterium]|nr:hypothetical protein [Chloroflexota bacterium]